jgi:hypothetical protein
MKSTDAAEAVAGAYYVVQLLPLDPGQAESILAMVEHALTQPRSQFDGWTGPAGHVFAHLRKKEPQTAAATIAVARDILQAVRKHFAESSPGSLSKDESFPSS